MSWSPGEIKVMIHHHTSPARWDPPSEWHAQTIARFMEAGLIEYVDGIPTSTPLESDSKPVAARGKQGHRLQPPDKLLGVDTCEQL